MKDCKVASRFVRGNARYGRHRGYRQLLPATARRLYRGNRSRNDGKPMGCAAAEPSRDQGLQQYPGSRPAGVGAAQRLAEPKEQPPGKIEYEDELEDEDDFGRGSRTNGDQGTGQIIADRSNIGRSQRGQSMGQSTILDKGRRLRTPQPGLVAEMSGLIRSDNSTVSVSRQ